MGKLISQWNIIVQGALQYNDYSKCQYFFKYQKWSDNTYRAPISETLVCRPPDSRCEPDHTQESLEDLSPTGSWANSQQNHMGCKNGRGHLQFFLKSLREAVQPLASRLSVWLSRNTQQGIQTGSNFLWPFKNSPEVSPEWHLHTAGARVPSPYALSPWKSETVLPLPTQCVIPAGEIGHNNPAAHTELPALLGSWISPSAAWNPPTRAGQCSWGWKQPSTNNPPLKGELQWQ